MNTNKKFINVKKNWKIKATSQYLTIYIFEEEKVYSFTLPMTKFFNLYLKDLLSQKNS